MKRLQRKFIIIVVLLLAAVAWAQTVPAQMCGTWSYLSGGQGSYMRTRTLVLNPDGTYYYKADYSSSGPAGSVYSDDSDSGTWQVQGNTIVAQSRKEGLLQLPFSMYPNQNGDIVLDIDGDVYVR